MPDATYSPKDALAAVTDRSLEDWLNSWWDLLCAALNYYQADFELDNPFDSITIEAIRRVRMEIVVGNRLSDAIAHNQTAPLLAGQAELGQHLPDEAARG